MPRGMQEIYAKVMQKTVLFVRHESQTITPVRTGNLRSSARTSVKRKQAGAKGKVWYNADYAVPVHERTWTNLVSGQHKFLEKAVRRSSKFVEKLSAAELKKRLRKFST